jgi:hypothetical protein
MKKTALPFLLIISVGTGFGQRPVLSENSGMDIPVFRTQNDSVNYYTIQKEIRLNFEAAEPDYTKADSLSQQLMIIMRTGIVHYRKGYAPMHSFIPFDSLMEMKDLAKVKTLSIANRKFKKLPSIVLKCSDLESIELVNTSFQRFQKKWKSLKRLENVYIYNNVPKKRLRLTKNHSVNM